LVEWIIYSVSFISAFVIPRFKGDDAEQGEQKNQKETKLQFNTKYNKQGPKEKSFFDIETNRCIESENGNPKRPPKVPCKVLANAA
jgi:hypothetical protein